jgi:hypothetical protein
VPQSEVIFYQEDETVFVRDWLKALPNKVQRKCLTFIAQLEMQGHELRRPIADFLRDGIYELRPAHQNIQYRILYFFSGKDVVVLSHGITKEGAVPGLEINRAIERKKRFEADPKAHAYKPRRQNTE